MEMYGGVELQLRTLLTSALHGGEWLASCPGNFIPGEQTQIGGQLCPRDSLYTVAKSRMLPCQELNPNYPANSLVTTPNELPWLQCTKVEERKKRPIDYSVHSIKIQ